MDDGQKPNNPLSPYYPSEVPAIPGNGRKWFAILVAVLFLLGAIHSVLSLLSAL